MHGLLGDLMRAALQVQARPRTRGVQQRQVRPQQQGQGIVDPVLPHIRLLPPVHSAEAAPTDAGELQQMMPIPGDLEHLSCQCSSLVFGCRWAAKAVSGQTPSPVGQLDREAALLC